MAFLDLLEADLGWREREIALSKISIRQSVAGVAKERAIRAAWLLLYAHYEGFVKHAFQAYFEAIKLRCGINRNLPDFVQVRAAKGYLRRIRSFSDKDLLLAISSGFEEWCKEIPEFGDDESTSNLWPQVLLEWSSDAGLVLGLSDGERRMLTQLVARRNNIAHGERHFLDSEESYFDMENIVYSVIYKIIYSMESIVEALQ